MADLRSFIFLDRLQPQTMCYLGTWIRGTPPRAGVAAQIIEVAPGLDIEPLTNVALKEAPVAAGILFVERQFGYLELHGAPADVRAAAGAVLEHLGATAADATAPQILASRIVSRLDRQHAFLINRNKIGSMALTGETLYVRFGDWVRARGTLTLRTTPRRVSAPSPPSRSLARSSRSRRCSWPWMPVRKSARPKKGTIRQRSLAPRCRWLRISARPVSFDERG